MGSSEWGKARGAMWLPLGVLCICLHPASSFYFREYGVVKPDDPYLFVGEDLVLFCNLTKLEMLEDSTYLYFTRNGVNIPAQFVDILTTRSVRLRYPIRRPDDEGHFVCWLRQERGNARTIGSQYVKADYAPVSVKDINCTVYNWENMTCQWDLGRSYHHPEYIHVSLVWTISGKQKDCPEGHLTNTSCTWVRGRGDSDDNFLPGHKYIMRVEVSNTRRGVIEHSQTFHIRTVSIVKPSPVINLHRNESNSTCLWMVWYHRDTVHDKVAFVEYLSQWNSSHWHKLEQIHFKEGPTTARICQLTPFTEYTLRVAVKPLPRADGDGYRSQWKYLEKVRTDPSTPEVSPAMCIGCFTDVPCSGLRCRNIIVYWKPIPWPLRRSVIHSYQLQWQGAGSGGAGLEGRASTLYPNTSHLLPLTNNSDYTLSLAAVTSENKLSRNASSLLVAATRNKPSGPESLIIETDFKTGGAWTGQFDLKWSDAGQSTVSFLIAWCRGNIATLKCDHEEKNQMQWQEVSTATTQFHISVAGPQMEQEHDRPSGYIVGVARQQRWHNGQVTSSGLTWAPCFYRKNSAPRFIPQDAEFSKVYRAGTLRVTWTYRACDSKASDVYVSRFIVNYCVISDTANNRCKGSEYNTTVRREARSAVLEGLQQGAYYRVTIAAHSRWGAGKRSEPVYSRVLAAQQQEEPRDFTVIGVILAVVVLVLLLLIGLCKIKSRIRKNQDKFITSFGDLPSLPPDNPVKSFKDRPLPQVPPGTTSIVTVSYTSGAGPTVGTDKRQRGSKHKSITSETSLLGSEEAGGDEDSRRRHRSGASSMSERCKLLSDDGVNQASASASTPATSLTRYDSDSGAESRYSSEDHDYASVEGGSAEEGLAGVGEGAVGCVGGAGKIGGCLQGGAVPRAGYVSENKAVILEPGLAKPSPLWKSGSEHKPAPTCEPPPLPLLKTPHPGFSQASLVPQSSFDATTAPSELSTFRPQPAVKVMGRPQRGLPPAQMAVTLESVQAPSFASTGGYSGSEDPTLPRRPLGSKIRQYAPYAQHSSGTASVDPYASTAVASFSKAGKGAEHGERLPNCTAQHLPSTSSMTPSTAYSDSSYSDDGHPPEPIYNPPWESSSLVPYVADNRPLSEYMLRLPNNFFEPTIHEGPTTEL